MFVCCHRGGGGVMIGVHAAAGVVLWWLLCCGHRRHGRKVRGERRAFLILAMHTRVHTTQDRLLPSTQEATRLASRLPDCSIIRLQGSGHISLDARVNLTDILVRVVGCLVDCVCVRVCVCVFVTALRALQQLARVCEEKLSRRVRSVSTYPPDVTQPPTYLNTHNTRSVRPSSLRVSTQRRRRRFLPLAVLLLAPPPLQQQ